MRQTRESYADLNRRYLKLERERLELLKMLRPFAVIGADNRTVQTFNPIHFSAAAKAFQKYGRGIE